MKRTTPTLNRINWAVRAVGAASESGPRIGLKESLDQLTEATEPRGDGGPAGKSKSGYFVVIALVAAAMSALPGLLAFELLTRLVVPYFRNDISSQTFWIQALGSSSNLISTGLFFVILYFYGKVTRPYFADSYLRVILSLFLGSLLGYAVYLSSFEIFQWLSPYLSNQFWASISLQAVNEGLRNAFVGFAALGLSYLRGRNPPKDKAQSPLG